MSGLHREDFELYEDKARKDITVFEEVKASAAPLHRPAAAPQFFSNVATTDAVPRRLKIIVIDEINTRFLDQTRARQEIIQYLSNSVTTDELTELLRFTPTGIEVIHDFSSDPAILVAALKNVRGRLAMTESGTVSVPPLLTADPRGNLAGVSEMRVLEMRINRLLDSQTQASPTVQSFAVERTLDAFEAIASACVGLPGRKSLIWVSAGFPFMLSDTSILSPRVMQSRHVNQRLERILDSLNAANIAVYPVDPSGLPGFASLYAGSAGYRGSGEIYWERMARASQEEAQAQAHGLAVQTMEEMAHMTGGVSYHDSNDISGALARASEDSAAYYLLGYYVSRASTKPGWHKLKVHVKQLHLSVRARSGYFLMATSDFTPDEVRARDISNAIGSPLDLTGISILARILPPAPPAGEGRVYFELYLKGLSTDPAERNHLNLQVVGLVSDGKLHEVTRVDQTVDAHPSAQLKVLQNGMLYKNSFALAPGEYSVKFVVRDNLDGHLGSLSMPLTVH